LAANLVVALMVMQSDAFWRAALASMPALGQANYQLARVLERQDRGRDADGIQRRRYRVGIPCVGCHGRLGRSHGAGLADRRRPATSVACFIGQGVIATFSTPSR
jgi:hypothetical protein